MYRLYSQLLSSPCIISSSSSSHHHQRQNFFECCWKSWREIVNRDSTLKICLQLWLFTNKASCSTHPTKTVEARSTLRSLRSKTKLRPSRRSSRGYLFLPLEFSTSCSFPSPNCIFLLWMLTWEGHGSRITKNWKSSKRNLGSALFRRIRNRTTVWMPKAIKSSMTLSKGNGSYMGDQSANLSNIHMIQSGRKCWMILDLRGKFRTRSILWTSRICCDTMTISRKCYKRSRHMQILMTCAGSQKDIPKIVSLEFGVCRDDMRKGIMPCDMIESISWTKLDFSGNILVELLASYEKRRRKGNLIRLQLKSLRNISWGDGVLMVLF